MNDFFSPYTGNIQVLCDEKVNSDPSPRHGLPKVSHGPHIDGATAERAALGAHPVHPDVIK